MPDSSATDSATPVAPSATPQAVPCGRITVTGRLRCHRIAQRRRGRDLLGNLIADLVAPFPTWDLWVLEDTERESRPGRAVFYKQKSGRLPAALDPSQEGEVVTVVASITPWSNGLGGYMARVGLQSPTGGAE